MSNRIFSQHTLSRRDFLRMSALSAGGLFAASGLAAPLLTLAQDTTEMTLVIPGRELEVKFYTSIVDAFNAKMEADGKPWRVTLNAGPATDNDYKTKITLDASSGTLGDVAYVQRALFPDMVAAGYLADLSPMLADYADWDKFAPVIKDQLTVNGSVYGLGDASTFTMFYRKDLLEEAGIPVDQPATWDDFFGLCDQILTKTGATPAGIPAARSWGGGTWEEGFRHVWLGYANSNEIYDPADSKWVVKSDGLLKALQVYETLAKNGWLTVDALLAPNPWEPIKYQGFPQKTVAVVTGGDWQWEFDWGPNGATPIEGLLEKVERWLFPSEVGAPFAFSGTGRILGIFSQSANVEGAFEFVTWSFSPEGSCKAYEVYFGGPSARSDMADNCEYYKTGVAGKIAAAGATLDTGRYLVTGPGEAKIADGIALATEDIITQAKTAEEAMDAFAQQMNDLIGAEGIKEL